MPAAGRSNWLCGSCRAKLGTVRGTHPKRSLTPEPGVRSRYRQDDVIELTCPTCKKVNRFGWRVPRA
jgi:hypothetical protein